ncbi:hypothetical protein [Lysinibacillus sp. 54212]|uniref:hypothetical protein n=1 Tax=Lysinibacillus sp. 54212 TaxID=3119829 RepID=UPI002FC73F70
MLQSTIQAAFTHVFATLSPLLFVLMVFATADKLVDFVKDAIMHVRRRRGY